HIDPPSAPRALNLSPKAPFVSVMGRSVLLPLSLLLLASASLAAPAKDAPVYRPTLISGTLEQLAENVRVGSEGAEWVLPGGSSLTASPGAELRILGKPQSLDLGTRQRVPGYTVILKTGLVRARVSKQGKSAIVVAAPKRTSVLVALGETSVLAGRHVAVASTSGKTFVGSGSARMRTIEPGVLEVLDDGAATRRTLLASPAALRGTTVLLSQADAVRMGELGWDPVPGAVGYRVELREQHGDRLRARLETEAPRVPEGFATLPPGGYQLRVVALDAIGMESAEPLTRALHVVRLTLPAGGYLEPSGALRIPAAGQVSLTPADGLEMAYGMGSPFAPAPASLELNGEEPRLVRLRAAGQGEGERVWLFPRQARAHVEFEPRAPRWPEQPLVIRVRLEDKFGVSAASWVKAEPRVSVGVEAVPVTFSQDGDSLKGVLPPRSGNGPWVVRVEVVDQRGLPLGRDFVEVITH
ncbi:MAG TPA: hypothetical protein VGK73_17960, partial [Polyangiaceae bacterium]